jgi:integrase
MRKVEAHPTQGGRTTYKVRFRDNRISPKTGKRLQASETFDTKTDAMRFAGLLDAGMDAHAAIRQLDLERGHTHTTLDTLAEQFFTWKATRVRSDRTVADYRRDYTNWIRPNLGSRAVDGITERDVQSLVDGMAARLSPKSVADRHAILHGIFAWAIAPSRRLVEHNPCIGTDLPKRVKSQPKGLRPAEWQALYAALVKIDPDGADLALFLLATGWRISEAAALSVFDVEDTGTTLHVNMGRVVRRNAAGEHVIVEDAKSAAGIRRIQLDRETADMVRRRIDRNATVRRATTLPNAELVFTTAKGSQWHSSNFNQRIWKPAVRAAGLSRHPTPHWLRHTSVAWLVMSGKVSLPEIQRRIGHEHISTTIDVYGRLIEDVSTDALEAFAAIRGPAQPRQIED